MEVYREHAWIRGRRRRRRCDGDVEEKRKRCDEKTWECLDLI